ncbi:fumarylacetoacetate hydrolase family protein [Sphingobacterium lactis]|uniref:Fumarylacetoacetate (FAA) hydrolase n=1 Tax=Sphingobacterium lactis TaxID=797291 RepID=A0A1H6BUN8_9SPHI|nr:fumarylacetoacetate hydrolase family protein [Sphingobacterium lactis]SEG63936.1 fumarylacetoacetate (FAA) hydrolase [Sphingobacterium lactis]
MKIVSYLENNAATLGFVIDNLVYPSKVISPNLPSSFQELLEQGDTGMREAETAVQRFVTSEHPGKGRTLEEVQLLAPLPKPPSFRDAYAFRQHVETSRLNRGLEMIPEFDQFPVFYFSNHQAIQGPGPVYCQPQHFDRMDFELEVAIVIGKKGKNISVQEADDHIAGFMILNDLSARRLQMEEMKLNLGPAKGKDFASMFGPYFVSREELKGYLTEPMPGHTGAAYNLQMSCFVNDVLVSTGNLNSMNWTFAEIIERVSYGVTLYPGDIIGSGTVGTGCFLELNGTGKRMDPTYQEQWLQPGDTVRMEVTALGVLENTVLLDPETTEKPTKS